MAAVVFQFAAEGMSEIVAGINAIGKATERNASRTQKARASEEKADQKAATATINNAKKREEARWREVEKSGRKIEAELKKETKVAEQEADKRIKLAQKERSAVVSAHKEMAMGALGKVASAGKGLAMGAAAGIAGAIGLAVRDNIKLSELANRISVNGRGAGETAVSPRALQTEFEATAKANPGITAESIALGVGQYISKTGDIKTARAMQGTFATVANATGASTEDIANVAADLSTKNGIKGVEDMQQAFAVLSEQGKKGAFELRDAAQYFSEMGAAGQRYGIKKGVGGMAQIGGLAQLARGSAGSGAEAATAVQRMMGNLLSHAGKLESGKYGRRVKVFDKKGNTKDIEALLADTIAGAGGNNMGKKKVALQSIFGDRGIKAASPLIEAYSTAFQGAKDDKKSDKEAETIGRAAIAKALSDAINVTTNFSEIQKDAAQIQQNASAQLTAAWGSVVAKTGDTLVPALVNLVPKFAALVPAIEPVIAVVGLFAGALGSLVKFLEDKKLITVPKESNSDAATRTAGELGAFQKSLGTGLGPLNPEDQNKLDLLQGRAFLAKKKADAENVAVGSEEGFAKAFVKGAETVKVGDFTAYKGTLNQTGMGNNKETAEERSARLFKEIKANPQGDYSSVGDTTDQKELIAKVQKQAQEDFDKAAASAAGLSDQLDQLKVDALAANVDLANTALIKFTTTMGNSRTTPNSDR